MTDAVVGLPLISLGSGTLSDELVDALIEMQVDLPVNASARCELRFRDPNFAIVGSTKLSADTPVEVKMASTEGGSTLVFKGKVTEFGIDHELGDHPVLWVVAADASVALSAHSEVVVRRNLTMAKMVKDLCGAAQVPAGSDIRQEGPTYETIICAENHLQFVIRAVNSIGGVCRHRDGKFEFAKVGATAGSPTTFQAEDLYRVNFSFDHRAPGRVESHGWDPERQQAIEAKERVVVADVGARFADLRLSDGTDARTIPGGWGQFSADGLEASTRAEAREAARRRFHLEATVASTKVLLPGDAVRFEGIGAASGTFEITRVRHRYTSVHGLRSTIDAGDWRSRSLSAIGDDGPGATMPAIVAGIVSAVDEQGAKGRVRVALPSFGPDTTVMARVATIGAGASRSGGGDSYGVCWYPEVDDNVLVAFERNRLELPVIIGGLYGDVSKHPDLDLGSGRTRAHSIITPFGHRMVFGSGDEPYVELHYESKSKAPQSLRMDDKGVVLTVGSKFTVDVGNGRSKLVMDDKGTIGIEGLSVEVKATGKGVKAEGPSIVLAADNKATLSAGKGAMSKVDLAMAKADLSSPGPVSVKGISVAIN